MKQESEDIAGVNQECDQVKLAGKSIRLRVKKIRGKGGFPIVGIGASAGGLAALEQFLRSVPDDSGMAFVIIQHLDPTHVGYLPELLQRTTRMRVFQVIDGLAVKPNCVYVIPPNKSMSILMGVLHLFVPLEIRGLRMPIDFFFKSLANDQGSDSIGVVLSGMGSDGTLGLRAIKETGGIVMAQDPTSAEYDSMPRSAIDNMSVDVVAKADELPGKLISLLQINPLLTPQPDSETKDKISIDQIITLLQNRTGNDFSMYKKNTLYRRIQRRMGVHKIDEIAAYAHFMQENPHEAEILFKELLIGVTYFFRDPAVWEYLREKVIPAMLINLPNARVLRAWVPGCSTGEEAYTLAIAFKEALKLIRPHMGISLQIFATDLDDGAIARARKGIYPSTVVSSVPQNLLNRYFTQVETGFRINNEIREMVVFATHNVIMDPPFTRMDFLSCRNLMIYMGNELQKRLLARFHYSLNPEGILILGNAESIGDCTEYFKPLEVKLRLFRRSASAMTDQIADFSTPLAKANSDAFNNAQSGLSTDNIQLLADRLLLQQFSPASVLVNDKGDIIYINGRTGKYLEPTAGKVNWNIFAMAREGLRNVLPGAFLKARNQKDPVIMHHIEVGTNGGTQTVDVTIKCVDEPGALQGMVMFVFTEVPAKQSVKKRKNKTDGVHPTQQELDLQRVREEMQNSYEQMQTSQEELKSTNEELKSTNEELQSTNEELITSKEEMQSLNEELQTVNAELKRNIEESTLLNSDLKNLLDSTEIATLFLDKDLRIRRFTNQVTRLFKLILSDIGRLYTDLATDLIYPELYSDAVEVLRTLAFTEKSITTTDGRWFLIRIMPYRTIDDRIDGLVITFIDTTDSKHVEEEYQRTQLLLESSIESANGMLIHSIDQSYRYLYFNKAHQEAMKSAYGTDVKKGLNVFESIKYEEDRQKAKLALGRAMAGESHSAQQAMGEKGHTVYQVSYKPILDKNSRVVGVMSFATEISNQTRIEEAK